MLTILELLPSAEEFFSIDLSNLMVTHCDCTDL